MGKINVSDKIMFETEKKENMEIKEIFTQISIQKIVKTQNSQLSKASCSQRERWHHLPYLTHIASLQVMH